MTGSRRLQLGNIAGELYTYNPSHPDALATHLATQLPSYLATQPAHQAQPQPVY